MAPSSFWSPSSMRKKSWPVGAAARSPWKLASALAVNGAAAAVITDALDAGATVGVEGPGSVDGGGVDGAGSVEDASSVQLPPSAAEPTIWVDASTTAPPVSVEKSLMNCWP